MYKLPALAFITEVANKKKKKNPVEFAHCSVDLRKE